MEEPSEATDATDQDLAEAQALVDAQVADVLDKDIDNVSPELQQETTAPEDADNAKPSESVEAEEEEEDEEEEEEEDEAAMDEEEALVDGVQIGKRQRDESDEDEISDGDDSLENVPLSARRKKSRILSDNEEEEEDMEEGDVPTEEQDNLEAVDDDDDEARSLRSIRTKGKYLCLNCGKGYTKPENRDSHYEVCKRKKMPFKCDKCERSYSRKTQLQSHQKTHTGAKPHQCGVCGRRFAWSNQLAQHAKNHEIGGNPFKCSHCGECFAEAATLVQHVKSHPREKKYDCTICGEMFVYIRDLRKHQVIHALDDGPDLDPDQIPSGENADLLSQSLQQSGLKPYGCPVCGKCFNRNEYLIQHMRMHTGEKPHVCGVCGDKFTWHNQLAFHAKQHPGEKVFKCQQCEESFVESSELAKHSRIHPRKKMEITEEDIAKAMAREKKNETSVEEDEQTVEVIVTEEAAGADGEEDDEVEQDDPDYVGEKFKPYGCETCGKFFARKMQLTSHQRTHTGEKPHACGLCDKRFSWANQLSVHIKMHHPGDKAFKCASCEECFSTSRELCLHNKTHKGSHECTPCGLVFPKLKDFVKHTKQVHGLGEPPKKRGRKPKEKTNTKDFQCDFCGLCFARRDNLKEHLRVHTGAKPFQCDICGKFFRLMGHLVKHKRTHTGEKPYRCETCYKCFTDSSKLARHVQMHTGFRPFICRTCYRYFLNKEMLAEHTKTHAGERKIRKPQKVDINCETCGKHFSGTGESTKCKSCRQITYECGICGDQFADSSDLLEHTKLHSGDWAYQYITQPHEMSGQTIIQTGNGNYEFATRQGGNLVIDVPAGATQEVIECILSGSDIVMQGQATQGQIEGTEMALINQGNQVTPIHIQHVPQNQVQEAIQQLNPSDMIQHEPVQQTTPDIKPSGQIHVSHQPAHVQLQVSPQPTPVQLHVAHQSTSGRHQQRADSSNTLPSIPEEGELYPDDYDDEEDDFFADLENQQEGKGKPFECPDCGKKFRREKWMLRHRRIHVKPEDEDQDGSVKEEKGAESEPEPELEPQPEPLLDDSDEEFLIERPRRRGRPKKSDPTASKATMKVKVPKTTKKNGYECTTCGKCFASAKWLAKHKETPHTCAKCDKVFLRAKNLKEHMRIHSQEAKYKCPLCQEPQMKFVSLLKHCLTHEEGNYRCPSCNKLFKKLENMVKHTRYHNQGVQHTCETCGKSFWQKWSLRQHQKVHSGEQPYQCETCGKCFTNIGNYKSHNRVHTGEKPYICETCGKAFREGGHLVKHRRTHTGEKPYVCNTCNACFTDSSKLARHKKTQHSNFGKGYKCETCGKCFSRIDNLHTHEKTHTGEKPPRKSPAKSSCISNPTGTSASNRGPIFQAVTAAMIPQDQYHRFERVHAVEVEHQQGGHDTHPGTPIVEEIEQPVHTIEILRTPQEQTDQRTDQQFLTLLVQRLNQTDDPHNRAVSVNAAGVSALEPQVRVMAEPHPAHAQVRAIQGYNIPSGHTIHPMHQMQMQRPNVLNQFANVIDDYAIHYASPFLHRK